MTESPTAVMSSPVITVALRAAVLALTLAGRAVLCLALPAVPVRVAFAGTVARDSTFAPDEVCFCRLPGAPDGPVAEQPAAQAATIAPSIRALITVLVFDTIASPRTAK